MSMHVRDEDRWVYIRYRKALPSERKCRVAMHYSDLYTMHEIVTGFMRRMKLDKSGSKGSICSCNDDLSNLHK